MVYSSSEDALQIYVKTFYSQLEAETPLLVRDTSFK